METPVYDHASDSETDSVSDNETTAFSNAAQDVACTETDGYSDEAQDEFVMQTEVAPTETEVGSELYSEGSAAKQLKGTSSFILAQMATMALQMEALRACAPAAPSGSNAICTGQEEGPRRASALRGSRQACVEASASGAAAAASAAAAALAASALMPGIPREEVQKAIFVALDADGDHRLSCAELLRFAQLCGFDGDDEAWNEEFEELCETHAGSNQVGPTEAQFRALLDDDSDTGMYCHYKELVDVCRKLATPNEAEDDLQDGEDEEQSCDLEHSGMDAAQLLKEMWDEGEAAGDKLGDDSDEEDNEAQRGDGHRRAPHSQQQSLDDAQRGCVGRHARRTRQASLDEAPFATMAPPRKRSREGTGSDVYAPRQELMKSLPMELLALGSKEALHNSKKIPSLAKRIAAEHLPTAGAAKVLSSMATVFLRQDVMRPHKLSIAYVFHELLNIEGAGSAIASEGPEHFLEVIGQAIVRQPPNKLGPFHRLLDMWKHIYAEEFLAQLRESWSRKRPPAVCQVGTVVGHSNGVHH